MKEIVINSAKYGIVKTMVDDCNYEWLNQWKWGVLKNKKKGNLYIIRSRREPGKRITIFMARLILGINDPLVLVDHKDNNSLNNTLDNLRIATYQQNGANKLKRKKGFSKYKGVHEHIVKQDGRIYKYFRGRIVVNYKKISLGIFKDEIEAAKAYNEAALKYQGEFARLNVFT